MVPPDQPGNPAQQLDVLSGRGLGTHDEEEEPDRLSVDGVEGDRLGAQPADHTQLPNR